MRRRVRAEGAEFLTAYWSARFSQAAALMAEARVLGEPWRLAKLYDLYAERMEGFVSAPPPAGWDGVFTATSK